MDLHLTPDPHDRGPVRLFVHGTLVAEYSVGLTQDRDSLLAEVTAARAYHALAREVQRGQALLTCLEDFRDHVNTTVERKSIAWVRGVTAGHQESTTLHPSPGVPPAIPEHTMCYEAGYEHGQALRRCLDVIAAAEHEKEA
jgi:hypothetical protein